jgi:hypothetical protein
LEQKLDNNALFEKIGQIIELRGDSSDRNDIIRELIFMAVGLSEAEITQNDLKTFHLAFREMQNALAFFAPFTETKKVSVFGSARTPPTDPIYSHAAAFSRKMARAGFMVITGAGDGIMRAVHGGAGREKSFGLNIILPFEQAANEFIENDPKLITFKYFFIRKLFFVKEANALAFFPGGFGTHDEGFETLTLLQTGKCDPSPVVFIDAPGGSHWKDWFSYINDRLLAKGLISAEDINLFKITDSISDAVYEITHFYHNYHSMQFMNGHTVINVNKPVTDKDLEQLNDHFSDIIVAGKIVLTSPFTEEDLNPSIMGRLLFQFNRRNFGRLRELINAINDLSLGNTKQ